MLKTGVVRVILEPSMWWIWVVVAALLWIVASFIKVPEGTRSSIWRSLAAIAVCLSLLICLVNFIRWIRF